MNTSCLPVTAQRLNEIAREYRADGYQVVVMPDGAQLPAALANFHFDLLAVSPKERVVVEVTNAAGLAANRARPAMAAAVAALPDWRFDLISIGSEATPPEPLGDALELPPEEIHRRVGMVRLRLKEEFEAAVLVAWSLAEAAMRVAARRYDLVLADGSPLLLITTLYSAGVIGQTDFGWLKETLHGRRVIAHGYAWPKTEGGRASRLLDFTEKMLGPDPAAA